MVKRRAIVWFRQDLRMHDNEALSIAMRMAEEIIPVYVFDERVFGGRTRFGFPKTGRYRAKFVIESVQDLRLRLRQAGSDLVVRYGRPECMLDEIAQEWKCSWVLCNRERTREEVQVQDALEQKLWGKGVELLYSRGKMLYHTQDLPVPVHHTPDLFTQFRKDNEHITPIRAPLNTPLALPPLPSGLDPGSVPTLRQLGHPHFDPDPRAVLNFEGGETAGLARLKHYLRDTDAVKNYKETRNGLLGSDYSSKLSPWLAQGCLSPKMVYHELRRYEAQRGSNESTYWLFFELLWRDFFRLMGKKFGNRIFLKSGPQNKPMKHLKDNHELLKIWVEGRTGVPFIDANMR
ncbi:MAG TPA: DASH family cryptochrome, partial [Saprospiraceae bacterium]|nr:DASH family cryptochrome [Saprospiraceae bacterium]